MQPCRKHTIDGYVLGTLYARQGDFSQALREYHVALRKTPRNVELLNDVAFAYGQQGDLAQCEQFYRRTLEVMPGHPKARTNLAILLAQQNRLEESLQHFSMAVGPAAAHSNLGAILIRQGRHQEAERHLQQALSLDRSLSQPRQRLAELATQTGQTKELFGDFASPLEF